MISKKMSLHEYMQLVNEDVQQEIAQLQMQISQIDQRLNSVTQPLINRKNALVKLLATKQKTAQSQPQANTPAVNPGQPIQQVQPNGGSSMSLT